MIPLLNRGEFKPLLPPHLRKVASAVAEGMQTKEIAAHLGICPQTVKNYRTRLYGLLGVKNRVELAALWNTELFQIGLSA